jgi:hypothetical protein
MYVQYGFLYLKMTRPIYYIEGEWGNVLCQLCRTVPLKRRAESPASRQHAASPAFNRITQVKTPDTDKKENQIFLKFREIQNGAVAKSYMTNGLLIYGEIFAPFLL